MSGAEHTSESSHEAVKDDRGLSLSQAELIERMRWLVGMRWLAFGGVIVTVFFARAVFVASLPWDRLLLTAFAIPSYNLVLLLVWRKLGRADGRSAKRGRVAAILANVQISCDLLVLGALIHFSGGIENPFGFYFVFHMVIASSLLSPRATYAQATLAVMVFLAVALGEYWGVLASYISPAIPGFLNLHTNPISVFAACWVMTTCLYVTVYLATSISSRLRRREAQIVLLSEELRRRADELQSAYDRLSEIEKAKSAYTRKVAHELRSPLAAVEGLLRTIADGLRGRVSRQALETIARSRHRIHSLLDIVRDLLALASATEVRRSAEWVLLDLRAALNRIVELLSQSAHARGISVNIEASDDAYLVRADPEGMEEVLTNLLGNAIKYSFEGGAVQVRMRREGESVLVEVADSGIGIDSAQIDAIFQEFRRADNARAFTPEGTGLGLSIVKEIVESHGGTIGVASALGKGTTFTIRLPALQANENYDS